MSVRGQHRAAAAGVSDDWSVRVKGRDVLAGQLARAFEISRMSGQRAATYLLGGRADVQIIRAQHSRGGSIDPGEQPFAHAACKQRYVLSSRVGVRCSVGFVIEHRTRTLQQREPKLRARREQTRETQFQQQSREPEIAKPPRRAKEHAQPWWR